MLVTARAEYACLAMLELAARYEDSKPVRLSEVADKHDIPQRFLVQILLQMKAAGYVNTTRGSAGGYRLARRPEHIRLADILSVLDRMEEPEERTNSNTVLAGNLNKVWRGLAEQMSNYLHDFKLSDLLPKSPSSDYVI